jgi:outer membrane protein assembly factor BamE (lipoprotein component of BamABCDE complex)
MTRFVLFAGCAGLAVAACSPASEHARDLAAASDARSRLTLGTVQREIRVGMSGEEVVSVLGAPNMVTTDEARRESWVYDRLATEHAYSSSAGGANVLFLGVSGRSGAGQTTQRSLTVIVRFDDARRVRDFSYRSSSF